jgi:acetyltransferase (GNAT) family protein
VDHHETLRLATLDVIVVPDHQRLGLGSRLITRGLDHLVGIGIHTVRGSSVDGPGQHAVAARFGFAEVYASSTSVVDPRTVEPMPVRDGVTLRSFGEIDDPRPLYELDPCVPTAVVAWLDCSRRTVSIAPPRPAPQSRSPTTMRQTRPCWGSTTPSVISIRRDWSNGSAGLRLRRNSPDPFENAPILTIDPRIVGGQSRHAQIHGRLAVGCGR